MNFPGMVRGDSHIISERLTFFTVRRGTKGFPAVTEGAPTVVKAAQPAQRAFELPNPGARGSVLFQPPNPRCKLKTKNENATHVEKPPALRPARKTTSLKMRKSRRGKKRSASTPWARKLPAQREMSHYQRVGMCVHACTCEHIHTHRQVYSAWILMYICIHAPGDIRSMSATMPVHVHSYPCIIERAR